MVEVVAKVFIDSTVRRTPVLLATFDSPAEAAAFVADQFIELELGEEVILRGVDPA